MHLKSLVIKNFRALEDIDVQFDSRVSVIVGPNAIGKTTLLEAIRLAKAMVAPRSPSEAQQALMSLGAVVAYNPQRLIPTAVFRDTTKPIEINCNFQFFPEELASLETALPQISTEVVLRSTGQAFSSTATSIVYLSSPEGQAALKAMESELRKALDNIKTNQPTCRLHVILDPISGRFNSSDPYSAAFFSFLENRLSPNRTGFSYFPADRALPAGEQPVQLGSADAAQQVESHSSQPQLKYARLKHTVFNAVVTSEAEQRELRADFARIFSGILKGRSLADVGVNQYGLLSISIKDTESNRVFDLDGMRSGEKGLILTFLLIGRSIINGGMILLDEPELHLNPAVCRDMLRFMVEQYITRKNIQAIICSHSPEILAGAFDTSECSLYHLESERVLTKVRFKDLDEISEALRKLGTTEAEGLLYKAIVFVEGDEDVELLQAGFGDLLRRHQLKDLQGRSEVEKQIERLQEAEKHGHRQSPRYFIFDRDRLPTGLTSSQTVKLLQWGRYCLENYLIDIDTLSDLLKDPDVVQTPFKRAGDVTTLLRDLATSQLNDFVAKKVYDKRNFENPGIRPKEIEGKTLDEIAQKLYERLKTIRTQHETLTDDWKSRFIRECEAELTEIKPIWHEKWKEDCDGKRLFQDLRQKVTLNMPLRKFKKRVMVEMLARRTENWRSVQSLLEGLLAS